MRRLWIQIVHTSFAKAYALVTAILILAVTARYLGPAGRGVVAAATAWATMIATFAGLSLGQVAIYRGAGRPCSEWLPSTLRTLGWYLGAAVVLVWVGIAAAYIITGGRLFNHLTAGVLALAALGVPALIWNDYATSLLMALDSLKSANIAQAAASSVNAIVVVALLAFTSLGVHAPLIAIVAAGCLSAAITIAAIRKKLPADAPRSPITPMMLTDGLKLHANAIGTFFFTQANLLIVNHYSTAADTGFFGLAVQLVTVAQILPNAIGMVAYTLVGREGPDGAWAQQRRLLAQALGAAVCVMAAGFVLAPFGVRIVAGAAFLPSVPLFRIMLPALLGMTFSSVMASQWIGRGLFGLAAGITLTTGALNVVATFFVVPQYGAVGAAWVMVVIYAISVVINGLMAAWVERRTAAEGLPVAASA